MSESHCRSVPISRSSSRTRRPTIWRRCEFPALDLPADTGSEARVLRPIPLAALEKRTAQSALTQDASLSPPATRTRTYIKSFLWLGLGGMLVLGFLAGLGWKSRGTYTPAAVTPTAVDEFWRPLLHEQRTVVVCAGGVVFSSNTFSGVITAGKDIEYPFVSMQTASAIAQVTSTVARSGVATQLLSSPSTPLTDLREHPVVLLGAYNNQWAMRFFTLAPLRG